MERGVVHQQMLKGGELTQLRWERAREVGVREVDVLKADEARRERATKRKVVGMEQPQSRARAELLWKRAAE